MFSGQNLAEMEQKLIASGLSSSQLQQSLLAMFPPNLLAGLPSTNLTGNNAQKGAPNKAIGAGISTQSGGQSTSGGSNTSLKGSLKSDASNVANANNAMQLLAACSMAGIPPIPLPSDLSKLGPDGLNLLQMYEKHLQQIASSITGGSTTASNAIKNGSNPSSTIGGNNSLSTKMNSSTKKENNKVNHKKNETESDSQFKCEVCQEFVPNESRHLHIVQCKLYSKFVKKAPIGFKCQLCAKELPGKVVMLDHLKSSHPNLAKFFQPTKIKDANNSTEVGVSPGIKNEMNKGNQIHEQKKSSRELTEKGNKKIESHSKVNVPSDIKQENNDSENMNETAGEEAMGKENQQPEKISGSHFLCEFCQERIRCTSRKQHTKNCRLYSKFMKKVTGGYSCLTCTKEMSDRAEMYRHLRGKHPSPHQEPCKSLINDVKHKCRYCQEFIDHNYSEHEKACKTYSKCMVKIQDGYQCQICSKELQTSAQMVAHILFHVTPEIERKAQEDGQLNQQNKSVKETTPDKSKKSSALTNKNENKNSDQLKLGKEANLRVWIPKGFTNKRWDDYHQTTTCFFCEEITSKLVIDKHKKDCREVSKLIKGTLCIQCNIRFQCKFQVYQHVKKEHLVRNRNESIGTSNTSQYIKKDIAEKIIDDVNVDETENIKKEPSEIICKIENVQHSQIDLFSTSYPMTQNEMQDIKPSLLPDQDTLMGNTNKTKDDAIARVIPQPLRMSYFICPICSNKYDSREKVETHIELFHRIPIDVQKHMTLNNSMRIEERIIE